MSWLLVAAVLFAPFGAWASKGCDDACPCEEDAAAESHDTVHADDGGGDGASTVVARNDDCSDDCADCRCGAGATLAVAFVPDGELAGASAEPFIVAARLERQAPGRGATVFRPPRERP